MVNNWKQLPQNEPIELTDDICRLTLNIIGISACGFNFSCFSKDETFGKEACKRILNIMKRPSSPIINIMALMFPNLAHNFVSVGISKELKEDILFTDTVTKEIIKHRKLYHKEQSLKNEKLQYQNLLDIMISSQTESQISDNQMAEILRTIFFAGNDTTANLVNWCLFALSQEPEITAKVKKELDDKLDESNITYESLEKLVYLKAIIKETFRMYPPVANIWTMLGKDIEFKGYKVPAGVCSFIN